MLLLRVHVHRWGSSVAVQWFICPRPYIKPAYAADSPRQLVYVAISGAGNDDADEDSIGRRSDLAQQLMRGSPTAGAPESSALRGAGGDSADSERSFRCEAGASEQTAAFRLGRHLRKKLQQIEALERRRGTGGALDDQQVARLKLCRLVTINEASTPKRCKNGVSVTRNELRVRYIAAPWPYDESNHSMYRDDLDGR